MSKRRLKLSRIKQHFIRLRNNNIFEMFVIIIIVFAALLIGLKTYDVTPNYLHVLETLDWMITLFFLFEIIVRIHAEENYLEFFKDAWNVFDTIVIVISLIPASYADTILVARLLRVFRVLRLVSLIPELRMLVSALIKSLPSMGYVLLLMFIIFYIYGAMGSFLFEDIDKKHWSDISVSMLTLFSIITFDDWSEIMQKTMETQSFAWIYYLSFIFINAFVFLNMMIGIVLENMQAENDKYNLQQKKGEIYHIKKNTSHIISRLDEMEHTLKEMKQLIKKNNG